MTAREIAEKTWGLWDDYYKDGDLGSKEIIDIIETDIKALTIPTVVEQSEQLVCDKCGYGMFYYKPDDIICCHGCNNTKPAN
jgi:hypothetical protein